ncbi:sugar ABC transporter ATP-binding protein [Aquibium oceanicum]|uniref:D-xylose ABC transporter ATP-binding protein n=1 Tax=Aquibium oceanicum TaxID=1670800 RepID=A0A1L3SNV1_9HYPH|nr:sugar ABC transporter ATP-binding protein [Aquibium oceanicum]APH71015.1 D-xylose ABC transporter ATP-binding protein [Aquibium oceanicum]
MKGIRRVYPGVTALDGINLSVAPGEVVGIVGENGAGKSTLMKILGGVIAPSDGTIVLDGEAMSRLTVSRSMQAGIAFVHQELNLFENLSAGENVVIGREPVRGGLLRFVDEARTRQTAQPLLDQLGAGFDAATPVSKLSLAQMQLVEIAKALSMRARLVIMDEPTSSLTVSETERLLAVVARLKADGVAVILVTHRLAEVERSADRVVVLRDGQCVAELDRAEIRAETMIRHMIGRDLTTVYRPPAAPPGEAILELRGVSTSYRPGRTVDLCVRRGEILGLAGLVGSGRTELARTIFGLDAPVAGEVWIDGARLPPGRPRAAIARGLYLVPEDRKRSGLVLDFPIRSNVTLASVPSFSRRGLVDQSLEEAEAASQRDRLDIRTPSLSVTAGSLSGGNQQKVVLGKWLSMAPKVLIFDEPTRGIDVGAKNEIYRLMRELADGGVGILMISSDMEEVIGVSNRVAVMHEGGISGHLEREALSERAIMSLAVGRPDAHLPRMELHSS